MPEYLAIEDAQQLSGLRLILNKRPVPGPWREACKGLFHVKKIPFVSVQTEDRAGSTHVLQAWTAQTSSPVAVWNDERPRSSWVEQLFLAERLQPDPPLIPATIEDRALMFGYCNELCGEQGFAWSKRLLIVHTLLTDPEIEAPAKQLATYLGNKYGYSPEAAATAPVRMAEILRFLGTQLERQRATGRSFFVGDHLSALDIYWAAFAAIVQPLPHDLCLMPPLFRRLYTNTDPVIAAALSPILLAHRDFIYRTYLPLPIDL